MTNAICITHSIESGVSGSTNFNPLGNLETSDLDFASSPSLRQKLCCLACWEFESALRFAPALSSVESLWKTQAWMWQRAMMVRLLHRLTPPVPVPLD